MRKGQSTVEYVVLVVAVIAVIIFFVGSDNSPFKQKINSTQETMEPHKGVKK